ncbi:MAG: response regulator receiver [Gemmatimonadetes bacterium]|nr:response regulator receiver [Gemmatimonadota bacterium]
MARILIVDDSNYARRVHRKVLEAAGHSIIEASTGMGAIESFSLEKPDAVLLDLSMEDLSGLEVLRTLRGLDPAARVVVCSADVQRSTEELVSAAGAELFLAKPADHSRLVQAFATQSQGSAT